MLRGLLLLLLVLGCLLDKGLLHCLLDHFLLACLLDSLVQPLLSILMLHGLGDGGLCRRLMDRGELCRRLCKGLMHDRPGCRQPRHELRGGVTEDRSCKPLMFNLSLEIVK